MDLNALIYGLGLSGLFTSRAFMPAFLTACVLRWGDNLNAVPLVGQLLDKLPLLDNLGGEPTWFTNGYVISALGILSVLEIASSKIPEAEQALADVSKYLKTGMAAATYFGLISTADAQFVEGNLLVAQAGFFANIYGLIITFTTYVTASARDGIFSLLMEADEDDDIGLRRILNWAEDGWAVIGLFWLVLYPAIVLIVLGVIAGTFLLIRKYISYKEEKSKIECPSCHEKIYPSATECPHCHAENPTPMTIGLFGGSKKKPVASLESHQLNLVEKKRCPKCATRFEKRNPRQLCSCCGHELLANPQFREAYLSRIGARVPLTLLICLGLSFVPFLGLVIGVILYRVQLVAPFRRYIPLHRSFFIKWFIRLLFIFLFAVQLVPGAGFWVVPVMAIISYTMYRRSFVRSLNA